MKRLAVLVISTLLHQANAMYAPLREYAGPTFFDKWAYYGNVDNTTWGNVTYLDQPSAATKGLTFINGAGNAIVKVDNTTTLAPGPLVNRDSIRLTSLDSYGVGTLILVDAVHIPYGCSVWPSFWTYGIEEEWPLAGEIDIIEAINNMDHNQVALHTVGGCNQAQPPGQTGNTLNQHCDDPQGCFVAETKPNSFGPGFAQAGGGVFALQIETDGIYSWFWSRNDIPDNVKSATSMSQIDTVPWGIPSAAFPATTCDIGKYFPPQTLVLLTTLCGVWAGVPSIYSSTCHTPTNSCVNDNVVGPGSNFDNAYWEIRYIRTYQDTASTPVPSSSPSPGTNITPTTALTSSRSISQPPPSDTLSGSSAASTRFVTTHSALVAGWLCLMTFFMTSMLL